jgi:dienelactone hydrolase
LPPGIRPASIDVKGNDMADVLLFHHAQGLTRGIGDFAEQLRGAGHTVHVPDLYGGQVFATLQDGAEYAAKIGFGTIIERGRAVAGRRAAR